MKLLNSNNATEKEVEYFGVKLIVPVNTKWIATNENGKCCAFSHKPDFVLDGNRYYHIWSNFNSDGSWCRVASFYRNGVHPKDTLKEVK